MENVPSKSLLLNFEGRVSLNDTNSLNIFSEYLFSRRCGISGSCPPTKSRTRFCILGFTISFPLWWIIVDTRFRDFKKWRLQMLKIVFYGFRQWEHLGLSYKSAANVIILIWELFHLQLAPCPKYMHLVYISKKHRSIFLSMFFAWFFENEDCKCCKLLIFLFPAWAQLKEICILYMFGTSAIVSLSCFLFPVHLQA